jgi:hypothetical protein
LAFRVSDASDAVKSYEAFLELISELQHDDGWNAMCNKDALMEARASLAYEWFEKRANGNAVCHAALESYVTACTLLQYEVW